MMNEANTISVKYYTPGGNTGIITLPITVHENGSFTLPHANEIDRIMSEHGYLNALPGAKPGEEVEIITHIVRCNQTNKDNSITPHIGFYHKNDKLRFAYADMYLNEPEQIAEFEAGTGVKLASIKTFPGTFPLRDNRDAQEYIIRLAQPIQVRFREETYIKKDKTEGKRKVFAGFMGSAITPASGNTGKQGEPVIVWSQDEQVSFWKHWNGDKQIAKGVILDVLGVKALGEFKNSLDRANTLMEMETRPKASGQ